jgi:peptidoglycan/LPS O-acetylase OafA/YrhL
MPSLVPFHPQVGDNRSAMPRLAPQIIKRIDGIDLLRGLSILSVILLHEDIRVPFKLSSLGAHLSDPVLTGVFHSGHYGVIIFFVISGFLITSISLKRWGTLSNIKPLEFYGIRFARIAPSLILVLAISSTLHLARVHDFVIDPDQTSLARALFSAVTFHLNWLEWKVGYLPGAWDVLWSLSVEEAFYLGFPLLCKWLKNRVFLSAFMMVFVVLGPFARTVFTQNDMWQDYSYLSCMDGIALGFFAAIIAKNHKFSSWSILSLRFIGISAMLFLFFLRKYILAMGLYRLGLDVTFLEIATAALLVGFVERKEARSDLLTAPLRWFGKNSYEIYLTHPFVVILLTQMFYSGRLPVHSTGGLYAAVICISGAIGYLLANYYSEPLNRIMRRELFA